MFEERIKYRNQYPHNSVSLHDQILCEWLKSDATYMKNVVSALPNKIQVVIKSRGGAKGY